MVGMLVSEGGLVEILEVETVREVEETVAAEAAATETVALAAALAAVAQAAVALAHTELSRPCDGLPCLLVIRPEG